MSGIELHYLLQQYPSNNVIVKERINLRDSHAEIKVEKLLAGVLLYEKEVKIVGISDIGKEILPVYDEKDYDFDTVEYSVAVSYTDFDIIQNQTLTVTERSGDEGSGATRVLETNFTMVHAGKGERNVIFETMEGSVAYLQCQIPELDYDDYYAEDQNPYSYY